MRGFQPAHSAKTKGAKPAFANGGPVRGPGTGTSDEVVDEVPPGTYIMPADSTAAVGEQALSGMGRDVPVNLSNGEFELPPEQVHAVGVQALDQLKGATHTPVGFAPGAQGGQEPEPRTFFADGGVVDEDERRRRVAQIPTGGTSAGPAYDGSGSTELSRNVNNGLNALGGMGAVASVPLRTAGAVDRGLPMLNAPAVGRAADFVSGVGPGATTTATAAIPRLGNAPTPLLPGVNAALQEGAQANSLAAAARAGAGAGAGANALQAGQPQDPAAAPVAAPAAVDPQRGMAAFGFNPGMTRQAENRGAPAAAAAPAGRGVAGFVADAFPNTVNAVRESSADARNAYAQGGMGAALGQSARVAAAPLIGLADDVATGARMLIDPAAQTLKTFVTGDSTPIGQAAAARGLPAARPAAVAGPVAPAPAGAPPATPGPAITTPLAAPAAAVAPAPAPLAAPVAGAAGVFRSGNSYSDSEQGAIAGAAPRGMPSAQNQAAAEALSSRQATEAMGRVLASQPREPMGGARGFSIGMDPGASRERKQLIDALTTPVAGARGITAAQRAGMAGLLDQEARAQQARANNETSLEQTAMQGDTQRGLALAREIGDTGRAQMREGGENARAGARNAIDSRRVGIEETTRGFEVRAAQRQEKLYEKYSAAETPEAREAVAKQIRDLAGKGNSAKEDLVVVGGGQEFDAASGVMRNVPQQIFDARTRQFVGGPQAAAPAPMPAKDQLKAGQVYQTPRGAARWDGKQFTAI